jgi:hypothetical protein
VPSYYGDDGVSQRRRIRGFTYAWYFKDTLAFNRWVQNELKNSSIQMVLVCF